jgi:hypothetical protein
MYKLNDIEIQILLDALTMAEKSAQRGKASKSHQFGAIYDKILTDITAIKIKLQTAPTK